jgi:hypothetical protein
MSIDSGVGSLSPLDGSRKDFKTNDTTPTFTGQLKTTLKSDEWIEVQLQSKSDGQVIDRALIKADGSETAWTWGSAKVLADGEYRVLARVVDDAGNAAVDDEGIPVAAVAKDVLIDTLGSNDGKDPNRSLTFKSIAISDDTAADGKKNADFVTSDGGDKDGQPGTPDDQLTFSGELNSAFTRNGGKVFVQIIDATGKSVSGAFVEPSDTTWSYTHIGKLQDGQYVAKAILMDLVGNMISAKDQSFMVDTINSDWLPIGGPKNNAVTNYMNYAFELYEHGTYRFNGGAVKNYTGGHLVLDDIQSTYAPGQFKVEFWDQAGNLTLIQNQGETWNFTQPLAPKTLSPTDVGYMGPKDLTGQQALGSVKPYEVDSKFDMASLYDGIDSIADRGAVNHVVLSNTSNVELTLSMGDVLALGVTNSFSVADITGAKHKGQIQMRIDGQTDDVLNLDGVVNGEKWVWAGGKNSNNSPLGIGLETYDVYTNTALGLALFVNTEINVL